MADPDYNSSSADSETDVPLRSSTVLTDLQKVQAMVDEMNAAPDAEQREKIASKLRKFLENWRQAIEAMENSHHRSKDSFGQQVSQTPSSLTTGSVVEVTARIDATTLDPSDSISCVPFAVPSATAKPMSIISSKSICSEASALNTSTVSPSINEGEQTDGQPLRLVTCNSVDSGECQPSITAVSCDSKIDHGSFRLQTVVHDLKQEDTELQTSCVGPSSCEEAFTAVPMDKDDDPKTQFEARVPNSIDQAVMANLPKSVTAIYEGLEQDLGECGLRVDVLDVAPCDQGDVPSVPVSLAINGEGSESLQSTRSGLVRKLIDFFNPSKAKGE